MRFPAKAFTATKTADGRGGYTESYDNGTTVWFNGPLPGEEVKFKTDSRETVNQGDVIEVSSGVFA
jgi:hypothetical protein